ncbi:MAG: hypothetical protein QOD24_4916 [Solirubrobacteraceae bacterium]|jgi:hypothetical protein|nr:hypothetical protein [Solirubrobacteraceae bacterium]
MTANLGGRHAWPTGHTCYGRALETAERIAYAI